MFFACDYSCVIFFVVVLLFGHVKKNMLSCHLMYVSTVHFILCSHLTINMFHVISKQSVSGMCLLPTNLKNRYDNLYAYLVLYKVVVFKNSNVNKKQKGSSPIVETRNIRFG